MKKSAAGISFTSFRRRANRSAKKSPIQDEYIEKYLIEKELDLTVIMDAKDVYSDADCGSIVAPANVYPKLSVEFS